MLAGGGVVFAAILFLMYWLSAHGYRFHFAVIGASLPFVFICVGFIELVTGSPYQRLGQRWMALAGWQRGVPPVLTERSSEAGNQFQRRCE